MCIIMCLPSQEGSGLKLYDTFGNVRGRMSSLARGKWIEASLFGIPLLRQRRLPSQEGSGLKRICAHIIKSAILSSLARGKWIEAYCSPKETMSSRVFPRKREVD